MINKEDDKKEDKPKEEKDSGFVDTARMNVQCHIVIKDKDTGKVILNKRG